MTTSKRTQTTTPKTSTTTVSKASTATASKTPEVATSKPLAATKPQEDKSAQLIAGLERKLDSLSKEVAVLKETVSKSNTTSAPTPVLAPALPADLTSFKKSLKAVLLKMGARNHMLHEL